VNLKKATLAAAVFATLAFVYPNLMLFLIYVAVMAAGGREAAHSSIPATAMWVWLPSLGLAAFLIVFFREQCGRARSPTRRKVARIGAVLMGVQAA
jgi:energy-coupling factor transporter transmembrane protein EcfT